MKKPAHFPSLEALGPVLIVGLGETGVAAANWCLMHGVGVRIADTRDQPPGMESLRADGSTELRLGEDAFASGALEGMGSLVLSPGLSPLEPAVASLLQAAGQAGLPVIGEIELFALALRDMAGQGYRPRVLGITGTNGKTTVTAMARDVLRAVGMSVQAAGNISPAALAALARALRDDALPEVWVLELSSFQLFSTHSLALDAAVLLNLSQDHLDWHGSFEAYMAAKGRLLSQTRHPIINRSDAAVCRLAADAGVRAARSFGNDAPAGPADLGLVKVQGMDWLALGKEAPGADPELLMPAAALRVRGGHNALNALAALALVRSLVGSAVADAPLPVLLQALRDYGGEPHRMAFVRSVGGVDFINDSKGTNVAATVAALQGMEGPLVLIAGGLAKGQDFTPLVNAVAEHGCPVVLIGRDAAVLAAAFEADRIATVYEANLEAAVYRAFALARPGATVLLSPACASMDMFDNYGERGRCFARVVEALALDQGEVA